MTVERVKLFVTQWRARILSRRDGRTEQLSDEELGQLVTLNTILEYLANR
jgi:hypothetical protein